MVLACQGRILGDSGEHFEWIWLRVPCPPHVLQRCHALGRRRWPGQGQEYAKLFKENVTINSFGASLSKDALSATLECFTKSAARMRRLALTMLPLGDKDMGALCGWLTNKQVRMRHDVPPILLFIAPFPTSILSLQPLPWVARALSRRRTSIACAFPPRPT